MPSYNVHQIDLQETTCTKASSNISIVLTRRFSWVGPKRGYDNDVDHFFYVGETFPLFPWVLPATAAEERTTVTSPCCFFSDAAEDLRSGFQREKEG